MNYISNYIPNLALAYALYLNINHSYNQNNNTYNISIVSYYFLLGTCRLIGPKLSFIWTISDFFWTWSKYLQICIKYPSSLLGTLLWIFSSKIALLQSLIAHFIGELNHHTMMLCIIFTSNTLYLYFHPLSDYKMIHLANSCLN